jgi:serine/threonine protein kinase
MSAQVGQVLLNRYRVDAFLGRGGMAEVYKAWDARRATFVAIKLLNEDLAEDNVFLHRFAREARALKVLEHPHIVRFFGFEEARDLAFLVMEFIEGLTLRRYLHDLGRALTLPETLYVIRPLSSALYYAHQKGVYHCDVKPANVFIEHGGRVVLADFGVARLTESATVTFSTPGTPAYMSPEQCREEELDARTDIYSLGITAYEMLTLDRPFKGDTEETTGSQRERVRWEQMHLPPPSPRSVNPRVSPVAEKAILRALEKEAEQRHQDVLDFYQELSGAEAIQPASSLPRIAELAGPASSEILPPPPPPPPGYQEERAGIFKALPTLGAGLVVVGIAGAALIMCLLAFAFNWWPSSITTGGSLTPSVLNTSVTDMPYPTATPLPTLTPSPTLVSSPTNTPIPTRSSPSSCPGAPPQRVQVGERARVCTAYEQLILRAQPRRSSSELDRLEPGKYVTIIDGPICADVYSWWKVRTDSGTVGWVAEGGDEIDPYFLCPAK